MIKLKEIVGLPSLQYHIDNKLTLHENVYRYNSEAFIQLFAEAREAWRDGHISLNEQDDKLLDKLDTDTKLALARAMHKFGEKISEPKT